MVAPQYAEVLGVAGTLSLYVVAQIAPFQTMWHAHCYEDAQLKISAEVHESSAFGFGQTCNTSTCGETPFLLRSAAWDDGNRHCVELFTEIN